MQVVYFPDAPRPSWPRPVVALGNFDGLHRGHQKLIDEVRRQARERAGTSVAMIFDPHPPRVLRPDGAPPLLMTTAQKLEALGRAGMQGVAVVRFTEELSSWDPERFVQTVLIDWLRVAEVWVGANFLFGRDRSGTFTLLRALGTTSDSASRRSSRCYKDFVVSSTRVRHLIAEGASTGAGAAQAPLRFIDGVVVHGVAGAANWVPDGNLSDERPLPG
jgi:riboflavin kinase/FMN adenylyltransferase